jgi:pSer/pThr/pTyr-binding forkhead associated (FHA) protein
VEQVLNWWLLRAKSETDAAHEQTVEKLQTQMDEGMKSLWDDHTQVKAIADGENADPQRQRQADAGEPADKPKTKEETTTTATAAASTSDNTNGNELESGTFRVEIVGGPYSGETFALKPTGSKFCWIGRSQSKKFTRNGISLPHDAEVSTSHGKFILGKGKNKFVYVDDGSTNGSWINGEFIERHVEYPLETGMQIVAGATTMNITLSE